MENLVIAFGETALAFQDHSEARNLGLGTERSVGTVHLNYLLDLSIELRILFSEGHLKKYTIRDLSLIHI